MTDVLAPDGTPTPSGAALDRATVAPTVKRRGRPPSDEPGSVPVTTTMPRALRDWLRQYSDTEGVRMAQVITRALLELRVKNEAEKPKET